MHICKFQYGFGKKKEKFLWTRLRREGSEGSEGSEGKVLKMDRPAAGGFLSLTALRAEGCGLPCRAMLIKSALRDLLFCVIGLDWHSADWLAALATKKGGAADAAGCVEGLCSLRSGDDSACGAEGCGLPCRAINIIMPPFGGHVHIKYHNHSYPRLHRLRWMASHWIRGSRGSPMNPVRLHTLRHFVALFP